MVQEVHTSNAQVQFQTQSDRSYLFIKHSSQGKTTALIVYVDYIVLIGGDLEEMKKLKAYMSKEFEIKYLGALEYFLGIEVARFRHGIFISKQK